MLEELEPTYRTMSGMLSGICLLVVRTRRKQCCEDSFKGGLKHELGCHQLRSGHRHPSMTAVMRGILQARASNTLSLGLLKECLHFSPIAYVIIPRILYCFF